MSTGVASPYSALNCPGSVVYPPQGGPGSVVYNNWTTASFGVMGFPMSLEVSCDTFYYQLGWDLQQRFGVTQFTGVRPATLEQWGRQRRLHLPSGSERFQRYARAAGLGHTTGIDLPYEASGVVPDQSWCHDQYLATKKTPYPTCAYGWLPGYTVNMAIGQGDLTVSPLQMAVTYAAIANGGKVVRPQLGMSVDKVDASGRKHVLHRFKPHVVRKLPLDETELSVIRQGLIDVVDKPDGTAYAAFAGFPLHKYPIAGKTGTAERGTTGLNYAWFESYAPATAPKYLISVYVENAGHGGESAAPIARQIYEGIFHLDRTTALHLSQDASR
jgi:penicillin-binding protein 2